MLFGCDLSANIVEDLTADYVMVRKGTRGWVILDKDDRVIWRLGRRQAALLRRLIREAANEEVRVSVDAECVTITRLRDNACLHLYRGGHYAGSLVKDLLPEGLDRVLFALNLC